MQHAAQAARTADRAALRDALVDAHAATLAAFTAYRAALPGLGVPYRGELNPPLWEIGHVAWFQEWWVARNPQRALGVAFDETAPRPASMLGNADALYDSSRVPHATRWALPLPTEAGTLEYRARVLEQTLADLKTAGESDAGLYFHRLALFHEDMHNEAAIYMANGLGFAVGARDFVVAGPERELTFARAAHRLGTTGPGFAFDNELASRDVEVGPFRIDAAPVSNARFAAFVEAGGYGKREFWSEAGWAWRESLERSMPRFWRAASSGWQQCWFGQWRDLPAHAPVSPLNCHEAEAFCAWAGRRLPREAEWEHAALAGDGFAWGQVWEWCADAFEPYPGFAAHPYRDYSAPWFGSRRVLRGASIATNARMRHPRYRNFFTPERDDIFAGLRTCAA